MIKMHHQQNAPASRQHTIWNNPYFLHAFQIHTKQAQALKQLLLDTVIACGTSSPSCLMLINLILFDSEVLLVTFGQWAF